MPQTVAPVLARARHAPRAESSRWSVAADFSMRALARSLYPISGAEWPAAPADAACVADGGGWTYLSNSRLPLVGGVAALRFDASGTPVEHRRALGGANLNHHGCLTPQGSWLSAEDVVSGRVYEVFADDREAQPLEELGRFAHGPLVAAADGRSVYLSETDADGCLYRFLPQRRREYAAGRLEVLCRRKNGGLEWRAVPNPRPGLLDRPTRAQLPEALAVGAPDRLRLQEDRVLIGGGRAGDFALDLDSLRLAPHRLGPRERRVAGGPTGIFAAPSHSASPGLDLFDAAGRRRPLLRLRGGGKAEVVGAAFAPDGSRLYAASRRSEDGSCGSDAVLYEITGPFAG